MEPIFADCNWNLLIRRHDNGIEILRAATRDSRAVLPGELFGKPVVSLGDHALSPDTGNVEGESVFLRCGRADGEWDNRCMEELTLPAQLDEIGSYALYNCRALQSLRMHDRVKTWGSSALMNCRSLHRLTVQCGSGCWQETVEWFVGELSGELDVTVRNGSEPLHLIFPEYSEGYEENCPAHHFDYAIYGAGHPYHHLFRSGQLSLVSYDALWPHYMEIDHDPACALRMALARVSSPAGLGDAARSQYLNYLKSHEDEALTFALTERNADTLRLLLSALRISADALSRALARSRETQWTEASALLLEQQHKIAPRGAIKTFEL